MTSQKISLKNIDAIYLLPLLASSAILINEKQYREILSFLKNIYYNKREIYEVLLQNYLFAGFPSVLISLKIANEYFHFHNAKSDGEPRRNFRKEGEINCKKIYGDKYQKLINNIKRFSPDLSAWLVEEGYGKVLSRKGLSLKKRELSIIAVLTCLKYDEQLYSHINGAHRLGIKIETIENVINNIEILDKKHLAKFGLRVLLKFKKQKDIL
jgi:4-carboxymuconolactone decarboxylase